MARPRRETSAYDHKRVAPARARTGSGDLKPMSRSTSVRWASVQMWAAQVAVSLSTTLLAALISSSTSHLLAEPMRRAELRWSGISTSLAVARAVDRTSDEGRPTLAAPVSAPTTNLPGAVPLPHPHGTGAGRAAPAEPAMAVSAVDAARPRGSGPAPHSRPLAHRTLTGLLGGRVPVRTSPVGGRR